ncbi:MAG: aldehyde dehydrogenase family protein [Anaerolineae bacterium]|nr:aldehyde dehydrogenase family protein [Anaerolineae bacterium]
MFMVTAMRVAPVINPYDGSVVGQVPEFTEEQVREAISRAAATAPTMANMPAHQRGAILNKAAQIIADNADDLGRLMARENGKPFKYAKGEAMRAVDTFNFAADEARRLHGETIPLDAAAGGVGKIGYYVRVPVGVIAAITPFNFPINLSAHKIAPAIAAGCPVVMKPAPATPMSVMRLAEVLREAGLPDGAFEVVTGGADVGTWLTTDPRIALISFTGSPGVARQITKTAGLRRVVLELGGNAATIVDETANIDQAVSRTVFGGFSYSGQVCISVQRIYIQRSKYAEFRDKFIAATEKLKMGDPLDASTDIGPLINDAAAERVEQWINDAVSQGAVIAVGGGREGRMFQPTVLENVQTDMQVMCAEVFGPVVNLVPFDNFEDALTTADDSAFGLQAGVYTRDLNRAMLAVQRLNVGGVIINDVPTLRIDNMPYGGNRDSGVGREGPRFAIEEMTTLKMVVINTGN